MAKKSQSLVPTQDVWLNVQKRTPKRLVSRTGIEHRELIPMDEEYTHQENKDAALSVMNEELIREFKCTKPSEKLLVKILERNYGLVSTYQEKLALALDRNFTKGGDHFLKDIHTLGMEIDRCERRIITIIQTLKAAKQPPTQVNIIKAENAVIGNNQQFNNNAQNKDS